MTLFRFYIYIYIYIFIIRTHLLSRFWTNRGHRCRPFFPSVLTFNMFIAHRVQRSHCSSIFHRVLLTHAFALSGNHLWQEKFPTNIYDAIGGNRNHHETDLIPGSRMTWFATGATLFYCLYLLFRVFLSSGVTGACPVTTDLILRVNVRTTTTDINTFGDIFG